MTLQQIYYALTIADFGSMNKAAESLFISQPTLTSAVKELEAELDGAESSEDGEAGEGSRERED